MKIGFRSFNVLKFSSGVLMVTGEKSRKMRVSLKTIKSLANNSLSWFTEARNLTAHLTNLAHYAVQQPYAGLE